MKNEDNILEDLLKGIETVDAPLEGLKEKIYADIMHKSKLNQYQPENFIERLFFISPWRITVPVSLVLSYFISLAMGGAFSKFVGAVFGLGGV